MTFVLPAVATAEDPAALSPSASQAPAAAGARFLTRLIAMIEVFVARLLLVERRHLHAAARTNLVAGPTALHVLPPPSEVISVPLGDESIVTIQHWVPTNREVHLGDAGRSPLPTRATRSVVRRPEVRRRPEEQVPQLI